MNKHIFWRVSNECLKRARSCEVVIIDYLYPIRITPHDMKGPSLGSCHNRRFLLCQLRFVRIVTDWRLALMGADAGSTGSWGSSGVLLLALRLSLSDNSMKTAAIRMASSSMIFLLIVRFWYPDATLSSLSASFTSLDMFSTL